MARPSNTDQLNVDQQQADEVHPSPAFPQALHPAFYALVSQYEFRSVDRDLIETYLHLANEVTELRAIVSDPGFNRTIVTSHGDIKSHPIIEQLRGAERAFRYLAGDAGLTPSSRIKAPKRKAQRAASGNGKASLRAVV